MSYSVDRVRSSVLSYAHDSGIAEGIYNTFKSASLVASSRWPVGTNVFDREWDLLVVLDACRYDALDFVAEEYPFLESIQPMWSVGSATREWAANTYTTDRIPELNRTALIASTGAGQWALQSDRPELFGHPLERFCAWDMADQDDFYFVDDAWKHIHDDPYTGLTRPETVTERAIYYGRELDTNRFIVWYKQPHAPYTARAIRNDREPFEYERRPWEALLGDTDRGSILGAYLDELRYGLDSVEVLFENFDAETVAITSDHGETFGEWGMYSHPVGMPVPALRRVPWATTTARDTGAVEPTIEDTTRSPDRDIEAQLEKLGYL